MPLLLALITWASIALWAVLAIWWIWIPPLAAVIIWQLKFRPSFGQVLAAVSLPVVVILVATAQLKSNPTIAKTAQGFSQTNLLINVQKQKIGRASCRERVSSPV